jgi:biopolymer transport protein ExbB
MKKFCWTPDASIWDNNKIQGSAHNSNSLMKKFLTASFALTAIASIALAQTQPPPPPPAPGQTPVTAMTPGVPPPGVGASPNVAGVASPAAPGALTSPALGTSPGMPGAMPSPAVSATLSAASPSASPSAAPTPAPSWTNFFLQKFQAGGPIMWPILIVSIIAVAVVLERVFWWLGRWMRRDPKRIEKVFTAIENGDVGEASRLSRGSRDPVLRMMWNGLNHQHASLQGALQVAAGIEIKRAGRFLVVMDTLVTLAPLLGLLGTITGLMKAFGSLGTEELAVVAVTGGIAEALIATACGLGIAIFALIPFNFFTSRVSNLEFELQTAATNLEVMLEAQNRAREGVEVTSATPSSATSSSI